MSARGGIARARRAARSLDASQWRTLALMGGAVLALHAVGFFLLFVVVAPHRFAPAGGGAVAVGTGLTAYTLGLRHAFDADHIAAIDNTTRKLMAEGKRPMSVGFFFSLGHSTIVFGLAFLFALGVRGLGGQAGHGGSALHNVAGWVGTGVSGTFLYAIAAVNLVVLWGIVRALLAMRSGDCDEAALERQLASGGALNRVLGRFTRLVTHPRHMYGVGLLFGLGFDTATEVGLLLLAAGAAGAGLPFGAIVCLPVLFAAGMALLDTLDGSFMNFAYDWAFSRPLRKLYYNLTVTGLSVAVALLIGTIELAGLLAQRTGARGAFWIWLENINMGTLGFIVAGLFALVWALAVAVWRFGRIEARWQAPMPRTVLGRISCEGGRRAIDDRGVQP